MSKKRKNPIFLLSTRRSGTTLLQRILNSHKDITMWGEHGGFLKPIARSYISFFDDPVMKNMKSNKEGYKKLIGELKDDVPIFWHNSLDGKHFKKCYRELVQNLFTNHLGSDIHWGFKEVRYGIDDPVLRMLSELFPEAKFVYLFRKPTDMVKSAIGVWNKEALNDNNVEVLEKHIDHYKMLWLNQNSNIHKFYSNNFNGQVQYVCYEEMIKKPDLIIESLFEFLELKYDVSLLEPLKKKFDSGQNNPKITDLMKIIDKSDFKPQNQFYKTLNALGK